MQVQSLKRSLSLPLLTLYGLGTTIGAGIYVLVGKVAGVAGMLAPISFLVASVLAGLTALSFSQLVVRFPRSAGEAVYVDQAFGRPALTMAVGLSVVLIGLVSSAAIVSGAVGYLQNIVAVPGWLIVLVTVAFLTIVAIWGITESVLLASVATVLEIGGLVVIVWLGRDAFSVETISTVAARPSGDISFGMLGVLSGAILAFYAFIGFEDMVNVAEEVRRPERIFPRAIAITLVVTLIVYTAVSWVAVSTMPVEELGVSTAPLSDIFIRLTGWPTLAIDGLAVIAVLNGALVQIIMASRVLYGLGRQGSLPAVFASVSSRTLTPVFATGISAAVLLTLAYAFPLEFLARFTSMVTLLIFATVNLALVRLNVSADGVRPNFLLAFVLPSLGFVCCLAFVVFQLVDFFAKPFS